MKHFSWIVAMIVVGCSQAPGPVVECNDCADAVEPHVPIRFTTDWTVEPCDRDSKYGGPLVTWCTPAPYERLVSCSGACSTDESPSDDDAVDVMLHDLGPATVTIQLMRTETGEAHERSFTFEVTQPDRFTLMCAEDDCRAWGDGEHLELELDAFVGDRAIALDTTRLTSTPVVTWSAGGSSGRHTATVALTDVRQVVTVTHASGVTASLEVPSSSEASDR